MLSAPTARHHTSLGQRPRNRSPKENGVAGLRGYGSTGNPQSPIPNPVLAASVSVRVCPCLSVCPCSRRRSHSHTVTPSHSHAFLAPECFSPAETRRTRRKAISGLALVFCGVRVGPCLSVSVRVPVCIPAADHTVTQSRRHTVISSWRLAPGAGWWQAFLKGPKGRQGPKGHRPQRGHDGVTV